MNEVLKKSVCACLLKVYKLSRGVRVHLTEMQIGQCLQSEIRKETFHKSRPAA